VRRVGDEPDERVRVSDPFSRLARTNADGGALKRTGRHRRLDGRRSGQAERCSEVRRVGDEPHESVRVSDPFNRLARSNADGGPVEVDGAASQV
jgi:hypothetical protein